MIKITITIEETENKVKENNIIEGKYIISRSNFGHSYILGVPCKVVSEPFMGTYESYAWKKECMCIKVVSCITGLPYTIPYDTDWFKVYDSYASVLEASESFLHHGYAIYPDPEATRDIMVQVVGKKYYPIDNSYTKLLSKRGNSFVAGKEVKIISGPYIDTTPYGEKIQFVNVQKDDGSIVKCMFTEWKLLP